MRAENHLVNREGIRSRNTLGAAIAGRGHCAQILIMGDLLHETTPPLAWDQEGMPFQVPPGTVAWKVRRYTGSRGRPPVVFDGHGPAHLSLDATMEDLRAILKNEPGSVRLYPVNEAGEELTPVACIEVKPADEVRQLAVVESDSPPTVRATPMPALAAQVDVMELCRQMVASRDAHDQVMANMLTSMVQSTAAIQQSTAQLMASSTKTITVANGLDAVARLPSAPDAEEIAERVADLVAADEDDGDKKDNKSLGGFLEHLMTGPVGPMLIQTVGGFIAPRTMAQNAQAQVLQAEARIAQARAEAAEAEAALARAQAKAMQEAAAAGHLILEEDELEEYMRQREAAEAEGNGDEEGSDQAPTETGEEAESGQESAEEVASGPARAEEAEEAESERGQDPDEGAEEAESGQDSNDNSDDADEAVVDESQADAGADAADAVDEPDVAEAARNGAMAEQAPTEEDEADQDQLADTEAAVRPDDLEATKDADPPDAGASNADQGGSPPPEVMNADDLAAMLRVDRKTVYEYAARKEIPHQRLGKRLLFSRKAILEWLAAG